MKMLKTRVSVFALCSALMFPSVVGAATAADANNAPTKAAAPSMPVWTIPLTNVNGILVPGIYVNTKDSKVAFIPGGVGLVVVDKGTALPTGAFYVK